VKLWSIGLFVAGVVAAGAAFADGAPAPAGDQSAAANTAPPPKKNGFDPDKVVCKEVAVTGSHLSGERVCMTWQQWEQVDEEESKTYNDAMRRSNGVPGGSFGPAH